MKLLITTQVLDRDDAGYFGFFHEWVKEFAKHCEQVIVICLREGVHDLPANVQVYSLGKEKGRPMLGSVVYGIRFLTLSWRLRTQYDAVFVHMNPEYIVLAGWYWRLWHKKIVLWYLHRSVDLKLRIAALFVDSIATASKESFRLSSKKVSIVGHGIDSMFTPQQKTPSGELRIIYWGRLSPSKRIKEIIAAAAVLEGRGVPVRLTIVGAAGRLDDRQYIEQAKEQADKLPAIMVNFVGGVPHRDIPRYLKDADVCVNISTTQSMDKTVLEAMAAGLPVLSSNDAFRDVLAPYGLFVPYPEDAEALATAIEHAGKVDPMPLIEYVKKNHSLQSLIPKILATL